MDRKYDFSWIDRKLKVERDLQHKDSFARKQSDRWVVDQFTYPNHIVHWFMPGYDPANGSWDEGRNNFMGDEENYILQLNEYKKKFGA